MRISRQLLHFKRQGYWIPNNETQGSDRLSLWMQQLPEKGNTSGEVNKFITAHTVILYFRLRKKTKIL
jgi:hypothetical protein